MLRDLRTDIVCRKLQVARARKDETDDDSEHQRAEHHHGANHDANTIRLPIVYLYGS